MAASAPIKRDGGRYITEAKCPIRDCTFAELFDTNESGVTSLTNHLNLFHDVDELARFIAFTTPTAIVRQRLHPEG